MLLVVASSAARRAALLRAAGVEVGVDASAATAEGAVEAVRACAPVAVVIDAAHAEQARGLLARVREAAEAVLPAVLVLPADAVWLRGPIPASLQPCTVLSRPAAARGLGAALASMATWPPTAIAAREGLPPPFEWAADRREVRGTSGVARLTRSEGIVFGLLVEAGGAVVSPGALAAALWGNAGDLMLDGHARAAVRAHVYTLRRRLRVPGLSELVGSVPSAGYRLDAGSQPG